MGWQTRYVCLVIAALVGVHGKKYRNNRLDEAEYGLPDEGGDFQSDYSSDELQKCRKVIDDEVYRENRKGHGHPGYEFHEHYPTEKQYEPDGRRHRRFAVYRDSNVDFYRDPYIKPNGVSEEARRYEDVGEFNENQFNNINDLNDLYNADDLSVNQPRINRYEVYEAPEDEERSESEIVENRQLPPESFSDAPDQPFNPYPPLDQEESASGQDIVYGIKKNFANQAQYQANRGKKADKGYKSVHQHDERAKGSDLNERQNKQYKEQGGKKKISHDGAGHYGQHEEVAQGQKGAKFDEKKGHKKGHKTKGYHNKYHKDEYHKEHKFYDDYHKSGSHHRYGNFRSKHNSDEHGQKKYHHLDAENHADARAKKGYHNRGHVDDDHKGHEAKNGHENSHASASNYGKKGGTSGGKQYGYQQGHGGK